jgi:hypothetical protein
MPFLKIELVLCLHLYPYIIQRIINSEESLFFLNITTVSKTIDYETKQNDLFYLRKEVIFCIINCIKESMYHFLISFKTINCVLKEILQFKIKHFKPFSNLSAPIYPSNHFIFHSSSFLIQLCAKTISSKQIKTNL